MIASHSISFADIVIHRPNIAEVIVHEGVEIDIDMVNECQQFLLANLQHPFGMLVNKKNNYAFTFAAQLASAPLVEMKAIAVLVLSEASKMATVSVQNMANHDEWNLKIFYSPDEAMAWLLEQME